MGCGQCSSGGCGAVKAIGQTEKSNHKTVAGCSSGGCSSGGCNKMNAYDWLSDMDVPRSMRYDVVEVKFKGGRKEYFRNANNLDLYTGDLRNGIRLSYWQCFFARRVSSVANDKERSQR
jgi:hypothetical protein